MESIIAPQNTEAWLLGRGISAGVIDEFQIGWTSENIIIPIFAPNGKVAFNKYRRSPFKDEGPKYRYDAGASAMLYGAHKLHDDVEAPVIICEGELDALVLYSHGFTAVSSTGGAGTFLPEWCELLKGKDVIICYDNDKAGINGALHTQQMIPWARIALLPDAYGIKDVTDYCIHVKEDGADIESALHGWIDVAERFDMFEADEDEYKKRINRGMENRNERSRKMRSTFFIDRYIQIHTDRITEIRKSLKRKTTAKVDGDLVARAKSVPMTEYLKFTRDGFAECPFHAEKSASFHYMKHSNKGHCFGCNKTADVIEVVAQQQNLKYMEAAKYICR